VNGVATAGPEGTGFAVPITAGALAVDGSTNARQRDRADGGPNRLRQLHHHAVADGDAAIHLRGNVEVVRGDDGGKA
jgi:hypothetical protein